MKKLFCLVACFCGFSLSAVLDDGKIPTQCRGLTLVIPQRQSQLRQASDKYTNCFCPIQNSLECQICPVKARRETENITPDCGDPTPEVNDCEAPSPKPESPDSGDDE
jgi:hypothetical protein